MGAGGGGGGGGEEKRGGGQGMEEDKGSYHFTLWDVLFQFSVKQPVVQKRNMSTNDKNNNNDSNNDYQTHI